MNALTRKRSLWLVALAVAACAVFGAAQASSSAASKITLTEEDYFNTPGQTAALAAYSKAFEAAHPGVTVVTPHYRDEPWRASVAEGMIPGEGQGTSGAVRADWPSELLARLEEIFPPGPETQRGGIHSGPDG